MGWRRDLKIATTKVFKCPGCDRYVPRTKVRLHERRLFCPHCHAVIVAPMGEPTGHVPGLAPPPPEAAPETKTGGLGAALSFTFLAADAVILLYLLVMSPGILAAALVEYAHFRPIGWEAVATWVAAMCGCFMFLILTFPWAIRAARGIPSLPAICIAMGVAWIPVGLFHFFVEMPWEVKASHMQSWPRDIEITHFSACAATFSKPIDALYAAGPLVFEIENRGRSPISQATFTVSAGMPLGWFAGDVRHRYTMRNLGPGERRRIEEQVSFGVLSQSAPRVSGGGRSRAGAFVQWDHVAWSDGAEVIRIELPKAASLWPIEDCPGARRPGG
jgi:hypothetical protein